MACGWACACAAPGRGWWKARADRGSCDAGYRIRTRAFGSTRRYRCMSVKGFEIETIPALLGAVRRSRRTARWRMPAFDSADARAYDAATVAERRPRSVSC